MGVIRRLEVRIEMHCSGISNTFPMRTANLHTSRQPQLVGWCEHVVIKHKTLSEGSHCICDVDDITLLP